MQQFFNSWRRQPPEERRVDPVDGVASTLAEMRVRYRDTHSPEEVEHHWNNCPPGELFTNPANDPFMAHARPARPPPLPVPAAGAVNDPFLPHGNHGEVDAREDPFMAHTQSGQTPPGAQANLTNLSQRMNKQFQNARKHWLEVVDKLLGPGDPERIPTARNMLIIGPWLVYVWVLLVWIFLQHYSMEIAAFITVIMGVGSVGLICIGVSGRFKRLPTSPVALGFLCAVAIIVGIGMGEVGWNTCWQQYWWLQTGSQPMVNSASTPAEARVDAAVVGFWDAASGSTINGTAVDDMRAAGYRDGHYYCVAPLLDPSLAGASLKRVNFWAVGVDCCENSGSFTCDAARERLGGYGVVMLRNGPYGGEPFRRAVRKAEGLHGLVSAERPIYVRWVDDPTTVEFSMLTEGLLFIVLTAFGGFLLFLPAGYLVWYFGFERSVKRISERLQAWWASELKMVREALDDSVGQGLSAPKIPHVSA
jgi:hypothetical protein